MDIFELRQLARTFGLAERAIEPDLEWERGPVAIVLRSEQSAPTSIPITVLPCAVCRMPDCRC